MNTFKNCLWKLVVIAVVLMMVISGISNARSVYAVNENTQQTIVNQNETAPQTSEDTTQENAKEGATGTSVSASENEKAEEKTDADQSTGLDPPAATENKTDSVEMPEASFTASTDKLTISVTALANTFPKGTKMDAKEISASDAKSIAKEKLNNIDEAVGADITFSYEGKEIEPANNKNVTVKMTLKNEMDGKNFQVLHKKDSGDIEKMTAEVSGKKAVFKAKSFSIYVITSETKVDTYKFYDGDTIISEYTQKIKAGDTLMKPKSPEKTGYKFLGWATTKDATEPNFTDFKEYTKDDVDGTEHNIYAVFEEVHYVFFMDSSSDDARVFTTKEGKKDDKISTTDVKLDLASDQSVTGWYTDQALNHKADDSLTLGTSDIRLYPKIESGHYITFKTGENGSYIEPKFYSVDATVTSQSLPTPKRKGYAFKYWSTSDNGLEYKTGNLLSDDITLYAVWEADQTNYSVVYWKQSVTDAWDAEDKDKTYQVDKSVSYKAATGSTVLLSDVDTTAKTGFKLNKNKSTNKITVNADGKSTLNVYFDRRVVTFNFHYGDYYDSFWGLKFKETELKTYRGLFEAKFDDWPNGTTWQYGNTVLSFLDAFIPPNLNQFDVDFYPNKESGAYVRFYKETLTGSYNNIEPDKSVEMSGGAFYITDKYTGFTAYEFSVDNKTWIKLAGKDENGTYYYIVRTWRGDYKKYYYVDLSKNLYIRFSRNSYNLEYFNYDHEDKTEKVKYEAPLSQYANYAPTRPSSLDEGYKFRGWYKDEACTTPFEFDSTMPAHGIKLYAKWAADPVNVTVHLDLKNDQTTKLENREYASTISSSDLPKVVDADGKTLVEGTTDPTVIVPKDYHWIGWATKDDNGNYTLYNFNSELHGDLELYPYYINTSKFTVNYSPGIGTGTVTDDKKYAENAYADVKSGSKLKAPEGSMFLNWQLWKSVDGELKAVDEYYYPGDKIKITGNIQLVARYIPLPAKVNLRYHANNSSSSDAVYAFENDQENNKQLTIADKSIFAPEAWPKVSDGVEAIIDHWTTTSEDKGISYKPGDKVGIDEKDLPNELYAQWKYVANLTISNSVTGNQGDKTKYFTFHVVINNVKANTVYTLDKIHAPNENNQRTVTSDANGKIDTYVYLKDKESITFEEVNITNKTAKYSVSETDGNGYTTTYKIDEGKPVSGGEITDEGFQKSHTVTFTNNLNGSVPTGIQSNTIITFPLLIAGIGFVLRMLKIRNDGE